MPDLGLQGLMNQPAPGAPPGIKLSPAQRFRTSAQQTMQMNPVTLLMELGALQMTTREDDEMPEFKTYSPEELEAKYEGTPMNINWKNYTNSSGRVNESTEKFLYDRYVQNAAFDNISRSNFSNFGNGVMSTAGMVAGSLMDPINIATAMIPIGGISNLGARVLASMATPSIGRALLTRFAVGATEDALINGTFIQPLTMGARSMLGDNPTAQEYFANVAVGGLLGGGFRAVGGLLGGDATGERWAQAYVRKELASTRTEKTLENLAKEKLDAISIVKAQQEARGNIDGDINSIYNRATRTYSTLAPRERELGGIAAEFREGRVIGDGDITYRKLKKNIEAATELGGERFYARGATEKEARMKLDKRVRKSLDNNFAPNITREGNMYVAQYTRDTGTLGTLKAAGRTQTEAVRNLNRIYNEAIQNPKDFKTRAGKINAESSSRAADLEKIKSDLESGNVSTYTGRDAATLQGMAQKASEARARHADTIAGLQRRYRDRIARASTPAKKAALRKELNAAIKNADSQLARELNTLRRTVDNMELEHNISVANARNAEAAGFADDLFESPTELQDAVVESLNARNPKIDEDLLNMQKDAAAAETLTSNPNNMAKYAKNAEARIRNSAEFNKLTPEQQDKLLASYSKWAQDSDLYDSAKVTEAIEAFDACKRGM